MTPPNESELTIFESRISLYSRGYHSLAKRWFGNCKNYEEFISIFNEIFPLRSPNNEAEYVPLTIDPRQVAGNEQEGRMISCSSAFMLLKAWTEQNGLYGYFLDSPESPLKHSYFAITTQPWSQPKELSEEFSKALFNEQFDKDITFFNFMIKRGIYKVTTDSSSRDSFMNLTNVTPNRLVISSLEDFLRRKLGR